MKKFRLIRSPASSAGRNMFLDKKIFERYLKENIPVLRLYSWQGPSFTYGVSQQPQELLDMDLCRADNVTVAQRMTGGGVLFHNQELTYSFVCSKQDAQEPKNVFVSYRSLCAFLIEFYSLLGLKAGFALECNDFSHRSAASQICSASYEKYDLLINNRKIGGNAQKRCRQAIFQHGSVPIRWDWAMVRKYVKTLPEGIAQMATSLCEEMEVVPSRQVLEEKFILAFANVFHAEPAEEKEDLYEAAVA